MAEYHFVSIWQINAPIERVWEEIHHAERWPSWWKYVAGVEELEPGAPDGTGKRMRLLFRTRLPYTLGFDVRVTRVHPPSELAAEATGELAGTGRWTLTPVAGGTLVRYNWDIRTTRRWMNLLAPVARPVFRWNHDELMRAGGQSLARAWRGPDGAGRTVTAAWAGPGRAVGCTGCRAGGLGRAGLAQAHLTAMSLEVLEEPPATEGTMIATPSRLSMAERPPARAINEYCPATPRRVNVQGVGGSDAVLAARLAAGDDFALAEAFDALARSVYGSALGVLGDKSAAQDVVQDVFIELWAHPHRYDPAAGTLRTYVAVLARHRAVDLVRSDLRRVARQERSYRLTPVSPAAGVDDELMAAETVSLVRAAVQRLPARQRQVVELAYFEGLTYREVAHAAGIPEGTAKSRLRLALAKLEEMLDRQLLESS